MKEDSHLPLMAETSILPAATSWSMIPLLPTVPMMMAVSRPTSALEMTCGRLAGDVLEVVGEILGGTGHAGPVFGVDVDRGGRVGIDNRETAGGLGELDVWFLAQGPGGTRREGGGGKQGQQGCRKSHRHSFIDRATAPASCGGGKLPASEPVILRRPSGNILLLDFPIGRLGKPARLGR